MGESFEDVLIDIIPECEKYGHIVQKLLNLKAGEALCWGGNYGGYLSEQTVNQLCATGRFTAHQQHERYLDMHGYDYNDYWLIERVHTKS